ncbi:MAG: hypothetical protein ACLPYZ_10810 [Limisphaerales bacterium]
MKTHRTIAGWLILLPLLLLALPAACHNLLLLKAFRFHLFSWKTRNLPIQ